MILVEVDRSMEGSLILGGIQTSLEGNAWGGRTVRTASTAEAV